MATQARREIGSARRHLGRARDDVRRLGANVREAGENVVQAGGAAARGATERARGTIGQARGIARRRLGDVAERTGERLGEAAVGLGAQILHLPKLVRQGARRGVQAVESAGARAVVSMIQAGTKALDVAADYVSELAPRRRRHAPRARGSRRRDARLGASRDGGV